MAKRKFAGKRIGAKKGTFGRLVGMIFKFFPAMVPLVVACIVFSAVVSSIPTLFMQKILASIEKWYLSGDWTLARAEILPNVLRLGTFYLISIASVMVYTQMMAIITQGFLCKLRRAMFDGMQFLPVKFFDTHKFGDVMSYYTNDIDTLRQMISQSLPQLIQSTVVVITVFSVMLYFCGWLAALVLIGLVVMVLVTRKVGGSSARFFVRHQMTMGDTEGFVEEMMNGQKVVKVFRHEEESRAQFDRINQALYEDARKANRFANMLMPILHNIGNALYVLVAMAGGLLIAANAPNFSLSGLPMGISIVVPFLNMTRQLSGNVGQLSQQINAVVMGLAGADRVFELMDQAGEVDDGCVTLVDARVAQDGTITEADRRTGAWAWKYPHEDGTATYTKLEGDVRLANVDFAYEEGKLALEDVTVYAEPRQKVAFVGATGAGKTTITNLINRFYDIADGKIRYDGININKIRKADLRRSLGVVLQETSLFTTTVMENLRYGRLDATDAQCVEAAKLAGADDFISRLPDGYDTVLHSNGANLSQGQRQLIAIARAAVADPPVMILDEATSSIDTRTEQIVKRGMDKLMEGRTVFVIAHRLSTVMNADVIMVLDHGRIIERGSHEKLIAERGTYYRLYTGAFELE
jgi:ATP-binding cassette subfamily B multidrug efflux pump